MAVRALAGAEPIIALAARHGVSRPLVYRQMDKARPALDELFSPAQSDTGQDTVLFSLPVTKRRLEQVTLALQMVAHASMRGVEEFMHDVLGVSISLGTVHNIHQRTAQHAVVINDSVDLSAIRGDCMMSFFRARSPCSPASTPPRPIATAGHRRASRRRHLGRPSALPEGARTNHDDTIADAGTRLRAVQKLAWPGTPSWRRVPHPSAATAGQQVNPCFPGDYQLHKCFRVLAVVLRQIDCSPHTPFEGVRTRKSDINCRRST